MRTGLVISFALVVLSGSTASSRVWRVERDGSGDYTTIQPALDSVASGDTVLIGPGRFTETTEIGTPGWTENVCAAIRGDNISIIGSGPDVTFIGPAVGRYLPDPRPKGVYGAAGVSGCLLMGLCIENLWDGIYWNGGVEIRDCSVRGCVDAVSVWPVEYISLCGVSVNDIFRYGVIVYGPGGGVAILECAFSYCETAVSILGIVGAEVVDCFFSEMTVAVK